MLLFDDGKKLEKAVGEEAALVIVNILERMSEAQRNANATRGDVRETELRLLGEIEITRKEIKEVELRLLGEIEITRKEIKEVELRLQKEIREVELNLQKEIKEVELRLVERNEGTKHEMLKWVMGMFIAQTGVLAALYALMR